MDAVPDGGVLGRTPTGRPIAPGGWRRGLVGLLVGAVVGAVAAATSRSPGD